MNRMFRRGMDLLVRSERVEALLWVRLRFDQHSDAREPLFNRYAGFARSVARRLGYPSREANFKDAEQWAYEGLLQAIDSFDPLRRVPFAAFAKPRIAGSVRDGIARNTEVDAQRSQQRRLERERLQSLKERNEADDPGDAIQLLGRIAAGLAVGLMLEGTRLIASDDEPDPAPSPYDSLAWRQTQMRLGAAIANLNASEVIVIRQHYEHGLTFAQVATLMGLTRGRISQLHRAALTKLKKQLAREY